DAIYADWKGGLLAAAFRRAGLPVDAIAPLVMIEARSRRRAVLTAVRRDGSVAIGFHGLASHALVDLRDCAVMRPEIMAAIPGLRQILGHVLEGTTAGRVTVLSTVTGLDVVIG
ncbi:MAG TPA: hypothetical protein PK264_04715, partial [Hyphomicrobiaceae bacterium]|nr:hypothetical protein [Hyphomicrobiaceae bacterium]